MATDTALRTMEDLTKELKEIAVLGSCASILGWDEQTYMPPNGAPHRADQKSLIIGMVHKRATSPRIGEWLSTLEQSEVARNGDPKAANIREIRRTYDKMVKLPEDLVREIVRETTLAHGVWVDARKQNDFKSFLPSLRKIIDLKKQQAEAIGYKNEPYDALLDDFEADMTAKDVAAVFEPLRKEQVSIIEKIVGSGKKSPVDIIEREYPIDKQQLFAEEAAKAIGFEFTSGRLDITVHPFCSGIGPGDVRITTRYNRNRFNDAFFGVLHEAGHGIYEQNLPTEQFGTPLGEAASHGIHESQSRMWENSVGRSRPFWEAMYPRAQKLFPEALSGVKLDQFYFAINDVKPSLIRVEADEVTYNLHIMLRFEIEHALFRGDLKAEDIPGAWNEKFHSYLGLTPPDDRVGCLQDVHWSAGLIGYFPSYALGNLYAAQFFAQADKDLGGVADKFRKGSFGELRTWLKEKIHVHGRRFPAPELVQKVTGKPLSPEPFLKYLREKFYPLYGVS
jgi:carboxypeptidase Taq